MDTTAICSYAVKSRIAAKSVLQLKKRNDKMKEMKRSFLPVRQGGLFLSPTASAV
jgi:hypothetical protein